MFVAKTTIRAANSNAWGNHLVAGLGSLTHPGVNIFFGTTGALVGVSSSFFHAIEAQYASMILVYHPIRLYVSKPVKEVSLKVLQNFVFQSWLDTQRLAQQP